MEQVREEDEEGRNGKPRADQHLADNGDGKKEDTDKQEQGFGRGVSGNTDEDQEGPMPEGEEAARGSDQELSGKTPSVEQCSHPEDRSASRGRPQLSIVTQEMMHAAEAKSKIQIVINGDPVAPSSPCPVSPSRGSSKDKDVSRSVQIEEQDPSSPITPSKSNQRMQRSASSQSMRRQESRRSSRGAHTPRSPRGHKKETPNGSRRPSSLSSGRRPSLVAEALAKHLNHLGAFQPEQIAQTANSKHLRRHGTCINGQDRGAPVPDNQSVDDLMEGA
eukprot:gb/GFBE01000740.1/.p1 GENE.gb/GFBE01000740.1/~~gb/GFBE01000740.1/.p1  ORF type:complete len:276 (+),score=42.91 gb/GFBE01000740.1/:1-828(+)